MSNSYIESLPERCLELILDYLDLENFNMIVKCSERLSNIGKEVMRMREIRLHQVLRQGGRAKWQILHTIKEKETSPGQRFGSTLVYYDSSIYLFGGATVNWTTYNDLWRFDMIEKRWSRRIPRGTCPPPRASATGILYKDKLIIIGGFGLVYSIHAKAASDWDNLPWMYDFTRNEWKMMMVDTSLLPTIDDDCSSRKFNVCSTPVGQSSCLLLGDQIILFGGAKTLLNQSQGYHRHHPILPNGLSNEAFSLSVSTAVICGIRIFGDVKPMKRCGHSAMAIDRHKMLIFGGNLGPNTKGAEDMWMLSCVEPLVETCLCERGRQLSGDHIWYWTKIFIDTRLQPLLPFLNNATVFIGENSVTCTLVVLGGVTDEVEAGLSSQWAPTTPNNNAANVIKTKRLVVHSVNLELLLCHNKCVHCGGVQVLSDARSICDGQVPVVWSTTAALAQDLQHAPPVKQGFGMVAGGDSLFVYGGLCYKSVCTRPLYLLNDLMARDDDDEKVVSNCDLHRLTFASRAISL